MTEQTLQGKLNISRDVFDFIRMTLTDNESEATFLELKIYPGAFASALTGREDQDVEYTIKNLNLVGKIHEGSEINTNQRGSTTPVFQLSTKQQSAVDMVYFPESSSIINIISRYSAGSENHYIFYQLPEHPGITLCKMLVIENNKVAMFFEDPNTFEMS